MTDEALLAAADDLSTHLLRLGPDVHIARRLITTGAYLVVCPVIN
jgi:hypothetical protein